MTSYGKTGSTGQAKRPKRKEGETLKSFEERLDAWALKYDTGRQASRSLSKTLGWAFKRKDGQKATLNGKPVVWKDGEWRSASRTWKNAYGVGGTKPAAKKPKSKPQTPKTTPKPQTTAATPKPKPIPKKQTTQEVEKAGNDPMMVWARDNAKMIEKSGNQKQKDLLKRYKKHGLKKASNSLKVNAKNAMEKYSRIKPGNYGNAAR